MERLVITPLPSETDKLEKLPRIASIGFVLRRQHLESALRETLGRLIIKVEKRAPTNSKQ
jgi:hypothetical protein